MNEKQIESAVLAIYNNLIDEISVEVQFAEMVQKYPEQYREEILEMLYDYHSETV